MWSALQRYSTMLIQFISGIILARLLSPYDYGCIGMLAIFMVLAEAFIDGGFGSALIQKKHPTQEDYSTIFWWNLIMAVFIYTILFCIAPIISRFYDIPLLCNVLRIQGLVLFLYAFNIIQRNQLQKQLDFKVLSIVAITTSILSLLITIYFAYKGYGVWALVAQNLITALIPALIFWFYVKWRPLFTFSWRSFRELFSFGFFMFLTHLVNSFSTQIQGLLIGKIYSPSTMGYYSKAHDTEKLASQSISQVMMQVTYPLYSEAQDDKEVLVNMIKRLTSTIAYFTFPLLFILLLTAKPIFVLLFSDKWLQSVPYFQVLCLSGLAVCLQSVNLQTIPAVGKSRLMFKWTIIKRLVGLTAMICGLFLWGMKGLLCGAVFNSWFSYLINILLVSKYIGYKWLQQIRDLFPILFASGVIALVSFGMGYLLTRNCGLFADGLLKMMVYVIAYIAWSVVFKPECFIYAESVLKPFFNRLKMRLLH